MQAIVKNFFITGPPKSGKTTLLMEIIKELKKRNYTIAGITCPEVIKNNRRWGFKIIDLKTNKEGILASIEVPNGPVVSKYRVNMEDLEQIGVTALRNALYDESDIVIIDEIGKMELFSKNFANAVRDLLNSKKPVIGIVPIRSNHPLVLEIKKKRRDTKTYLITRQTSRNQREQIKTEIINSILTLTGKNNDKKD